MRSPAALVLRVAATLVLAAAAWAVLGYLATAPLGAVYGWSGHPPIPAAPKAAWIGLYLVALPAACLAGAWGITGSVMRRTRSSLASRRDAREAGLRGR